MNNTITALDFRKSLQHYLQQSKVNGPIDITLRGQYVASIVFEPNNSNVKKPTKQTPLNKLLQNLEQTKNNQSNQKLQKMSDQEFADFVTNAKENKHD